MPKISKKLDHAEADRRVREAMMPPVKSDFIAKLRQAGAGGQIKKRRI